jgi:hypothetical protein
MPMRVSDKLILIDKIGRALQAKFGYAEIDVFFRKFKIPPPNQNVGTNSKWVYSNAALQGARTDICSKSHRNWTSMFRSQRAAATPPKNWKDTFDCS